MERFLEIQKTVKDLENTIDNLHDHIYKLKDEALSIILNNFDLKGKYIKIENNIIDFFDTEYIYVEEIDVHTKSITIRGKGFKYTYNQDVYSNYATWDACYVKTKNILEPRDLENLKESIEIITKEEFRKAAEDMSTNLIFNISHFLPE